MKVVIAGGNAAGMSFAAKYKRNNPSHEVIVLEKRDYVSFGGCGLPYYVGGFFDSEDNMIARTVEQVLDSGIDLRINSEVIDIDFQKKTVHYSNDLENNSETYDKLIISTGANPIVPNFGDYQKDGVTTLTTMKDGNKLKKLLQNENNKRVTIIGGGFIGLEVMEAAVHLQKEVTLIEMNEHIMQRQFDSRLSAIVEADIKETGVNLLTNNAVQTIEDHKEGYLIKTDKNEIMTDIIVFSIGFSPNTKFINLEKENNGAIKVDKYSQTSQKDVYALGDAATIYNKILDKQVYLPLATSANKQARMLSDVLSGNEVGFKGMLSTSALKVLEYEMACTGITEEQAKVNGIEVLSKIIKDKNQTSYYPGQEDIHVKLVYRKSDKVILGAQVVGKKGASGRINAMAVVIQNQMTTSELGYIDFNYAPPFSRTWDVLNVAGNVAK